MMKLFYTINCPDDLIFHFAFLFYKEFSEVLFVKCDRADFVVFFHCKNTKSCTKVQLSKMP